MSNDSRCAREGCGHEHWNDGFNFGRCKDASCKCAGHIPQEEANDECAFHDCRRHRTHELHDEQTLEMRADQNTTDPNDAHEFIPQAAAQEASEPSDTKRLDWLDERTHICRVAVGPDPVHSVVNVAFNAPDGFRRPTLREAIDAAMGQPVSAAPERDEAK